MSESNAGLSPRMRGNPYQGTGIPECQRSIPAYAGEPVHPRHCYAAARVYPRVCGGTAVRRQRGVPYDGLSPRMRGNPYPASARMNQGGSIPAYAGEPASGDADAGCSRVYPRVCGGTA